MNALIVDDDPTSRCLLRLTLSHSFDWKILEAGDGLEGLRLLERAPIDVVFLDVHMPKIGGAEFLEILRASSEHAATPVFIMTAEKDADTVRQMVTLGVQDYLVKPLSAARIAARVERAMAHRSPGQLQVKPAPLERAPNMALLVDADERSRKFFTTVIDGYGTVLTAESGIDALALCTGNAPELILIGPSIGLLNPAFLIRRLRALRHLTDTRIYLFVEPHQRGEFPDCAGADGFVDRVFEADAFLAQFGIGVLSPV